MERQVTKKEVDLVELWKIVSKRKWIIIITAAIVFLGAGIYSFTRTPLYQATATILIEEPGSNMLNIEEVFAGPSYYRSDYLGVYFNTQLRLLNSRTLAERVARRMNLGDRPEFQTEERPGKSLVRRVKDFFLLKWLSPGGEEEPESDMMMDFDPNIMYAGMVMGGLVVMPVEETRLVDVGYVSPHPILAADIVNSVVEEFITYSVEMRYEATRLASEFLSEQISQLRIELAAKEREIQKYGEEKNLLYLDDRESSVVTKFGELNTAFTEAQIDRIKKEAAYRELQGLNIDSLPQYVDNSLIQNLKTEYSRIKNEFEEKSKIFKPDYPEMVRLKARLDNMISQLQDEIEKAVEAALSDYRAALKKEASLQRLLESQRQDVVNMNNNAILYNSLKIEVENKRSLLTSLVARQNETLVSARLKGLKSSNIKIIDRALIPAVPFSPNIKRSLMVALLFGLFLGTGLVFFIEYLDNTIKSPEDAEKLVDLPSLGVIPFVSSDGFNKKGGFQISRYMAKDSEKKEQAPVIKEIELINLKYPNLSISEDYRTIRTSILFSHADRPPKTIMFSSAFPQEGKTATSSNTAVSFAQLEKKVMIIDADMRKPRLHRIFKSKNLQGLSSFLAGRIRFEEVVQKTPVKNLFLISSGPHPPNPAELLDSRKMKELMMVVKDRYDIVLIDTPPVMAVIDPVIISSYADGIVLVVRSGKTTRKAFINSVSEISRANPSIIGIVYNEVRIKRAGYYSPDYHGYLDGYYEAQ